MTSVVIREATYQDALYALRKSRLTLDHSSDKTLVSFMAQSDRTYVGLADGEIVCVWGVMRQSMLSDRGYMWLITTEAAEEHKFLMIRYSQRLIEHLLKRYTILCGECHIANTRAIRWMKLLGATFGQPYGNGIPFQIVR